jgi:hypothetical protein
MCWCTKVIYSGGIECEFCCILKMWLISQLNFKFTSATMAFNLDPNIRAFVSIFSVQFSPWRLIWTRTFVHSWLIFQLNFKIALISMAFNLDTNIRAFVSIFSVQFSPWRLIWTRTFVHSWLTSKLNFRIAFFSFAIKFSHECTNIAHSWLNLNSISRSRFTLLH